MKGPEETPPVLDLRGVVKVFGENVVLRGIDLAIDEHRVALVVQPETRSLGQGVVGEDVSVVGVHRHAGDGLDAVDTKHGSPSRSLARRRRRRFRYIWREMYLRLAGSL